jgi:hypothetical protein
VWAVGVSRQTLHTRRMLGCSRGALVQQAVFLGGLTPVNLIGKPHVASPRRSVR